MPNKHGVAMARAATHKQARWLTVLCVLGCALSLAPAANARAWSPRPATGQVAPPVARPLRSKPLVSAPISQLRLPSHIPYGRLGLSGACALMAIGQQGTSEKIGWTALGTGLLTWALIDWFVPHLRSAAGS